MEYPLSCLHLPPSHITHTQHNSILNNVAIGAYHAKRVHNLSKIAVVDFDVHHGNGTQHILQGDASFFYVSVHRSNIFPGSGLKNETGTRKNVLNIPIDDRKFFGSAIVAIVVCCVYALAHAELICSLVVFVLTCVVLMAVVVCVCGATL